MTKLTTQQQSVQNTDQLHQANQAAQQQGRQAYPAPQGPPQSPHQPPQQHPNQLPAQGDQAPQPPGPVNQQQPHPDAQPGHGGGSQDGSSGYQPKPYQETPDETVVCPRCNSLNEPDAVYCDQCGFKLAGAQGVQTVSQSRRQQQLPGQQGPPDQHQGPLGSQTLQDRHIEEASAQQQDQALRANGGQVQKAATPAVTKEAERAAWLLERLRWDAVHAPNAGDRLAAQRALRSDISGVTKSAKSKATVKRGVVLRNVHAKDFFYSPSYPGSPPRPSLRAAEDNTIVLR